MEVHIDDPSRPPKSKREKYQFADAREKKSAADVLMDAWGLQFGESTDHLSAAHIFNYSVDSTNAVLLANSDTSMLS